MRNFQTGVSLVEILVVAAVGGVAGAMILGLWVQNNGLFTQQTTTISQNISLSNSISEITDGLRVAVSVVAGYPVISPEVFTGLNSIVVTIPSINISGDVIDDTYDYLVFKVDSQNPKILRKNIYPNSLSNRKAEDKVLSTNLSEIRFYYLDANNTPTSYSTAEQISFTIIEAVKTSGFNTQLASSSAQVSLRNN